MDYPWTKELPPWVDKTMVMLSTIIPCEWGFQVIPHFLRIVPGLCYALNTDILAFPYGPYIKETADNFIYVKHNNIMLYLYFEPPPRQWVYYTHWRGGGSKLNSEKGVNLNSVYGFTPAFCQTIVEFLSSYKLMSWIVAVGGKKMTT